MISSLAEKTNPGMSAAYLEKATPAGSRPAWRSPKLDMLDATQTAAGEYGSTDSGIFS